MIKDIYNNQTYLQNNPTWHEEDAMFKSDRIEKLLTQYPVPFNRVCEVGCGSGEILVQLSKRFQDASSWVGYDISAVAIAIAEEKSSEKLNFELQDFTLTDKSISMI